jgi:hypothetical protein
MLYKHNNFKISTFLQNLSNMQKYAHSNFRSDITAPINEFISHSVIFNNNLKKSTQMLQVPKPNLL